MFAKLTGGCTARPPEDATTSADVGVGDQMLFGTSSGRGPIRGPDVIILDEPIDPANGTNNRAFGSPRAFWRIGDSNS
jgi:hypothetical protein